MTNRLLTLAVIGAVGAGSATSIATAHGGKSKSGSARTQVATVTSYASGTLTLKTTGGATVTASVTGRTRISCLPLATGTTPTATTPTATAQRLHRGGRGEGGGRGGEGYGSDGVCDTTSLTAGAVVLGAVTELTTSGQRFTKVVLATPATTDDDYTNYS